MDLAEHEVVVQRDPTPDGYPTVRRRREGRVRALAHADVVVDVVTLLR